MTGYASCLLLNSERTHALLIKKNRPEFQAGLLNIVGGHIENGEHPIEAAVREVSEETGLAISILKLRKFCVLSNTKDDWFVHFFVTIANIDKFEQLTDEELVIVPVNDLPKEVLYNVRWLITLALDDAHNYAEINTTYSRIP